MPQYFTQTRARTGRWTPHGLAGCALVLAAGLAPTAHAATVGAGAEPAAQVLRAWIGADADKFDLALIPQVGGQDSYRVTTPLGRVSIEASSPATLLKGFNAYLGSAVRQSVSWNKSSLKLPAVLPPSPVLTATANVAHRFINNDTEDGYTGAYRTLEDWKKLVDVAAMHGMTEVFMPVGAEAAYLDTFTQYGYTQADILKWIPQAGHQPWWLLQNMGSDQPPLTRADIDQRAALGRQIADYIRALGMTPVLPGYFGTVPPGFATRTTEQSHVVPQGEWAGGYTRADWLDPTSASFAGVAGRFYAALKSRLGASTMYKADLLHEGGNAGGVDVGRASRAVEAALQKAHPGATWVLLGWQSNPPTALVNAVNKATTFIVDGLSDRYNDLARDTQWAGVPYAFGTIWNFGGHTAMGSQATIQNTRYFEWLNRTGSAMKGLAILPEANDNNPAAFDFFAGLAWRSGPTNVQEWFADYATRRYGTVNASANAAWSLIGGTAYSLPNDGVWSEGADGLFGMQPSLTRTKAASYSPEAQRYDMDEFARALPLLINAGAALKDVPAYRYDLMDVARQVLSNTSRQLLPQIKAAYEGKNRGELDRLSAIWLANMDIMDRLAGSDDQQLLGRFLKQASDAGVATGHSAAYARDARTLLTSWRDPAAGVTALNDYANREWNGLVGGYYTARWKAYFAALRTAISSGRAFVSPDWNSMLVNFAAGTAAYEPSGGYATTPTGDVIALAREALAGYTAATGKTLTAAPLTTPGAGVTYLSALPFTAEGYNPEFGPAQRNTEVGDIRTGTFERRPLRVGGIAFDRGLGVQTPSQISVHLGGQCTVFAAQAGIDDTMDKPGKSPNVIFKVLGDGRELYSSGAYTAGGATVKAPLDVAVDVTGVSTLTLVVDPNGTVDFDRAVWANARVSCGGSTAAPAPPGAGTTYLSHLPFASDTHEPVFGPMARDTAIVDVPTHVRPPITVGGALYGRGLGVQAPSLLGFNLGGQCSVFSAEVGVDATMDKPGKAPSMIFSVIGDGKELYSSGAVTGGAAKRVNVSVAGVSTLQLKLDPNGSSAYDRGNWASAAVTCR